jgi:hypothetical protein
VGTKIKVTRTVKLTQVIDISRYNGWSPEEAKQYEETLEQDEQVEAIINGLDNDNTADITVEAEIIDE